MYKIRLTVYFVDDRDACDDKIHKNNTIYYTNQAPAAVFSH